MSDSLCHVCKCFWWVAMGQQMDVQYYCKADKGRNREGVLYECDKYVFEL